MADPTLYLTFIAAVLVLAAIPGPNVAIIAANSISHGTRYGAVTVQERAAPWSSSSQ